MGGAGRRLEGQHPPYSCPLCPVQGGDSHAGVLLLPQGHSLSLPPSRVGMGTAIGTGLRATELVTHRTACPAGQHGMRPHPGYLGCALLELGGSVEQSGLPSSLLHCRLGILLPGSHLRVCCPLAFRPPLWHWSFPAGGLVPFTESLSIWRSWATGDEAWEVGVASWAVTLHGHVCPGDPELVTHLPGLSLLHSRGGPSVPLKVREARRVKHGRVWARDHSWEPGWLGLHGARSWPGHP